jgi:hypothetical protein
MSWQSCPVCTGTGLVSRPPGIAGDLTTWTSGGVVNYTCPTCKGWTILGEETGLPPRLNQTREWEALLVLSHIVDGLGEEELWEHAYAAYVERTGDDDGGDLADEDWVEGAIRMALLFKEDEL